MQKITDFLSINDWKKIAEQIQKLELPAGYYFDGYRIKRQLEKLKRALIKLNIDLNDGYTNADHQTHNDVGLLNLLENICSMTVPINYEQAAFYEKIYKLAAIGIRNISFNPESFSQKHYQIVQERTPDEGIHIIKLYTDGYFNLTTLYKDKYVQEYEISDIENANFILKYDLTYSHGKIKINSSHAIIRSFDSNNFPSVREIKRETCPDFKLIKPCDNGHSICKQEYKIISTENIRHRIGYPSVTPKQKYYYKRITCTPPKNK